ncbi:MAG: CoA transferase, partial [Deltaproteobacteria bacterium]|nr:CoA transferase [Deltaproteobacteria bacterium]
MAGPLAGVKVVSFGRYLSGPFAAMLMADLGAEVIKIEDRKGDPVRNNSPFVGDLSHYFLSVNRGKKSFSIDLRHSRTKAVLEELIKQTDILIEN